MSNSKSIKRSHGHNSKDENVTEGNDGYKHKTKKKKSCWVKEYRLTRSDLAETEIVQEPSPNIADFKNIMKIDEDIFNVILSAIRSDIEKSATVMRCPISAKEKLAVTLRFLATGDSFRKLDVTTKLSKSFLAVAIMEVVDAIYINLKDEFLKFPNSKAKWTKIAEDFDLKLDFPNCIGALDATHFSFKPAKANAPLFRNTMGYHSMVLLGIADAYARFVFVDAGGNGKLCDAEVLERADLMFVLNQADKFFPPPKTVGNDRLLPHVFVADGDFSLSTNVMTPYSEAANDDRKITYNCRLIRARQPIERAFALLRKRFRIFNQQIQLKQDKVSKIILCCCVLHNLLISKSRWYDDEAIPTEMFTCDESQMYMDIGDADADAIRDEFTNYFNAEGQI